MSMMMRMAVVSTITVLLLCCSVVTSTDSQDACDSFVARNGNFTVLLRHKLKKSQRLQWSYNGEVIFDRSPPTLIMGHKDDINDEGSLKLKNMGKNKEGKYTPSVFDDDGKAIKGLKDTKLCVLDPVPKPSVNIRCSSSSVIFTCNFDQQASTEIKFKWLQNDKVLEKHKDRTLTKIAKDVEKDVFSCNVSNPVSSMTSHPVKQNCTESGGFFLEEIFGIKIWIIVASGGGVVILLIIAIVVCCIHNRRRKRMQVKDEEELRLGFTNPNQQQHYYQHNHPPNQHPHHHHQQQHPAGHTGPRQHRCRQQRSQQHPGAPDHPNGHPRPSPRRTAQGPRPVDNNDDEQPPPLPQPRKKAAKTTRA